MTDLILRRRNVENHEAWDIVHGDVPVGGLSKINGTGSTMLWQWCCGFYPGCDKRQQSSGNEDDLDEAKARFREAWERLRPQITPAMLDEWRYYNAFTRWKYAMWDAGSKLPTQMTSGRSRCFCGSEIGIKEVPQHVRESHNRR